MIGYHPQIILAGRRLNDGMGAYVVSQLIKAMIRSRSNRRRERACYGSNFRKLPRPRNTRVVDIVHEITHYKCNVDIYDLG